MTVPRFAYLAVVVSIGVATFHGQPHPAAASPRQANIDDVVVVEDEATTAKARINSEAAGLLARYDFHGLDAMAERLRRDRTTYAQGDWPITFFFDSICDLPKGTPEGPWQIQLEALRSWFQNDPDSITPRVALARALLNYAFVARGNGWASTVTSEGWRLFDERVTEARRILIVAEYLDASCPVYFAMRLKLALVDGTPRDQYEELFNKSVQAYPTYSNFYRHKAYYLLPRWHGEEGEWENFAATAADNLGGEKGDALYAQIVWSMHDYRFFGNILRETKVDWPRLQRGLGALCRQYPRSIAAPSEYCAISGFATNGRQMMQSLFPALANRVDLSVWKTKEKFVQDRDWAFSQP
jgi:hypothetical protein